ncbi:HNH endonuclease [Lysobacter sp. HDW10]|uniref:HNH endonuclease n=1 Tax=Lysobacter sp. HDW10 TaxID=2714936 RepID=UPI00140CECE4|nr:HNH endonuclease [Lysobacter sp. HDW10]QIK80569.1 HNH endonuclease [Lysobacter sp. HDW10]
MDAYLLTWNPEKWSRDNLLEYIARIEAGEETVPWKAIKSTPPNSRVFLTKQGKGERGIFGSGTTVGEPFESPHFDEEEATAGKTAYFVNVKFEKLFDPIGGVKVDIAELLDIHPSAWRAQQSGTKLPYEAASKLETIWNERTGSFGSMYPDEIEPGDVYVEGAKKSVTVNRYERDRKARELCVAKWGSSCSVCSFHFEYVYGAIGRDFIHVHHLKPLSEIGVEYEVDPINDLRPVCPNCHAMLHRKSPALSIEELTALVKRYGKNV